MCVCMHGLACDINCINLTMIYAIEMRSNAHARTLTNKQRATARCPTIRRGPRPRPHCVRGHLLVCAAALRSPDDFEQILRHTQPPTSLRRAQLASHSQTGRRTIRAALSLCHYVTTEKRVRRAGKCTHAFTLVIRV